MSHLPEVTQERDNWSRVPHWLLTAVPAQAVVVYAQLAAYAWMPDGARPALQRVADDLKLSRSTVRRALSDLVGAGAVVVEERWADPERRQQLASRYHLRVSPLDSSQRVERSTHRSTPVSSSGPPRVTGDPTPRVSGDPTPGSLVTPEEEEVREEEVREEEGGGVSPARASAAMVDGPPLPRCAAHHGTVSDAPCRACGDARRAFDAWRASQLHQDPATPRPSASTYVPTVMCERHPDEHAGACRRCAHESAPRPASLRSLRDQLRAQGRDPREP